MHVLHVVESFGAGCLMALQTLCRSLQHDARQTVLYGRRAETPADVTKIFPTNVSCREIPLSRSFNPVCEWRGFWVLLKGIKQSRPDIVHCHSSKAGFWGRTAARALGIPSVYTPHGYAFLRTDISPLSRTCFKAAEWWGARLGSAIMACGDEEYVLSRHLAPQEANVRCVPNALNLTYIDSLRLEQSSAEKSKPQIGICGRVDAARNPQLFGSIAGKLAEKGEWHWIGAEENTINLPAHVHRSGWLDHENAIRALDSLDIYLHTSAWEGCSYAILEAMALGKPVIATDIPANRALVEHGVTGFLGSTEAKLLDFVSRLLSDKALRLQMGAAGRKRVELKHNAATSYVAYLELYRELLAKTSRV